MTATLTHLLNEVGRLSVDEDDTLPPAELWALGETLAILEEEEVDAKFEEAEAAMRRVLTLPSASPTVGDHYRAGGDLPVWALPSVPLVVTPWMGGPLR